MSEVQRQKLAAMMDGEVPSREELKHLLADPETAETWGRYNAVRSLLKGESLHSEHKTLTDRISQAILEEENHKKKLPSAQIIPLFKNVSEQVASFAVAASVTAMMVFGVQMLKPVEEQTPVNLTRAIAFPDNPVNTQKENTPIQEMLLDHTRESSRYGLQNMLDYVDVVSHTVTIPLRPVPLSQQKQTKEESEKPAKTQPPRD